MDEVKFLRLPKWAQQEITCLRANVEYYKEKEATEECKTKDGWIKTGDIGELNLDGSISVIDRIKNIFKLSQGEYIPAEYLETLFQCSKYISQICVHGEGNDSFIVSIVL